MYREHLRKMQTNNALKTGAIGHPGHTLNISDLGIGGRSVGGIQHLRGRPQPVPNPPQSLSFTTETNDHQKGMSPEKVKRGIGSSGGRLIVKRGNEEDIENSYPLEPRKIEPYLDKVAKSTPPPRKEAEREKQWSPTRDEKRYQTEINWINQLRRAMIPNDEKLQLLENEILSLVDENSELKVDNTHLQSKVLQSSARMNKKEGWVKQLKEIQNTVLNLQKVAAKVEEGSVRTSNSPLTPNTYEENTQDPPNTYTKGVSHMSPFPRSLPITTEISRMEEEKPFALDMSSIPILRREIENRGPGEKEEFEDFIGFLYGQFKGQKELSTEGNTNTDTYTGGKLSTGDKHRGINFTPGKRGDVSQHPHSLPQKYTKDTEILMESEYPPTFTQEERYRPVRETDLEGGIKHTKLQIENKLLEKEVENVKDKFHDLYLDYKQLLHEKSSRSGTWRNSLMREPGQIVNVGQGSMESEATRGFSKGSLNERETETVGHFGGFASGGIGGATTNALRNTTGIQTIDDIPSHTLPLANTPFPIQYKREEYSGVMTELPEPPIIKSSHDLLGFNSETLRKKIHELQDYIQSVTKLNKILDLENRLAINHIINLQKKLKSSNNRKEYKGGKNSHFYCPFNG